MSRSIIPGTGVSTNEAAAWVSRLEAAEARHAERTVLNVAQLNEALARHQITHAVVNFDGSGDDGDIVDISLCKDGQPHQLTRDEAEKVLKDQMVYVDNTITEKSQKIPNPKQIMLDNALDRVACDVMDMAKLDWCNNDGGYGSVTFEVNTNSVHIDFNARFTESKYSEYTVDSAGVIKKVLPPNENAEER